ncbi:maleylpyruvate isomerase family mycothiol-dependent enzyme [Actinomadura kijaniata]|uniref:maleylpyruvate isomerase family mycothiol-dependent enzyme n=1 Tax=Actinomadura kijaniata TaxID=46161 RepID=UPI00082C4F3E|nr:maleylpyruvate isomerase family mycothiol-dependent enzyme [Actinomadura kijaniata]
MDHTAHFRREVEAFEAAVRPLAGRGDAPLVPSCPEWTVSDLVVHLGWVHRWVAAIVRDRRDSPPEFTDTALFGLPEDHAHWPDPRDTPNHGPLLAEVVDWFAEGAAELAELFAGAAPDVRVWTWSQEQSVGFWQRMQAIEAAVHRWDAENAVGAAPPLDGELAADMVPQTFEVMVPARREWRKAPAGEGETYRFRRNDGPEAWTVRFDGDDVRLGRDGSGDGDRNGGDVEVVGSASDLALFLWGRVPAERMEVRGDPAALERYFALAPPV